MQLQVPTLKDTEITFSVVNTDKNLLSIAEEKQLELKPYVRVFNKLFFSGGKLYFKENLDPEYKNKLVRYLKALMVSFSPKQEHKEAVCSLFLSELVDEKMYQ